jgi:hypothetical protein
MGKTYCQVDHMWIDGDSILDVRSFGQADSVTVVLSFYVGMKLGL